MKTILFSSLLIILISIATSCTTYDESIHSNILFEKENSQNLALGIAKSLANPSVRQLVKSVVVNSPDGDFNILLDQLSKSTITGKYNSTNYIKQKTEYGNYLEGILNGNNTPQARATKSTFSLADLLTQNPLLQLSIPVWDDERVLNWDIQNEIPLVTIVPESSNIKNLNSIEAFDHEGNSYSLSTKTPPDQLVVVIKQSERIIAIPKRKESSNKNFKDCALNQITPVYQNDDTDYYLVEDYYEAENLCVGGSSGFQVGGAQGGNEIATDSCPRINNDKYDYIRDIRFRSLQKMREASGWLDGKIELRAVILAKSFPQPFNAVFYEKRNSFRSCGLFTCELKTYDPNYRTFRWRLASDGDRILIVWYEDAPSDKDSFKITSTFTVKNDDGSSETISFEYNVKEDDLKLGDNFIEFCDPMNGEILYQNNFLEFKYMKGEV